MNKSVLIIGQAQRPETRATPFLKSNLWKWLAQIGYEQNEIMRLCHFDALVDHGTPKGKKGRLPPKAEQMKLYRPKLMATIDTMRPQLVVPVGNLAVRHTLHQNILLEEAVGQKFSLAPFGACQKTTTIIPLPHPSGVSLWLNAASNKRRLQQALDLLSAELASFKN